jgi:hypothetical protein
MRGEEDGSYSPGVEEDVFDASFSFASFLFPLRVQFQHLKQYWVALLRGDVEH